MPWRRTDHHLFSAFRGPLDVQVCRPADLTDDEPAPLLWVHDGPAYDIQAGLTDWVAAQVGKGELPRMRLVLTDVRRRLQWYSASPRYLRSFSLGLTQLERVYAVSHLRTSVVTMGASLGGLTALLAAQVDGRVGGVFAQSGSFFTPATDPQESGFPHFDRITGAVGAITRPGRTRPFLVGMTCGCAEENLANNRLMAVALVRVGIDPQADLAEVDGGHDYRSWGEALDPALPRLLHRVWG